MEKGSELFWACDFMSNRDLEVSPKCSRSDAAVQRRNIEIGPFGHCVANTRMAFRSTFRLLGYLKRHWPYVIASVIAILVLSGLDNITPLVIMSAIDNIVSNQALSNLLVYGAIFAGVALVKGVVRFLSQYGNQYVSNRLAFELRNDLFKALQSQSFTFYDKARTGQLLARLTSDVDEIRWSFGMMIPATSSMLVTFVMAIVIMLSLDFTISLYSLAILPILIVLVLRFAYVTGPLFMEIRKAVGNLSEVVQENLSGVKVVRAFSAEEQEMEKYNLSANHLLDLSLRVDRARAIYMPMTSLVVGAASGFIILFGGLQVIQGTITLGSMVALISYLSMVAGPIRMMGFWIEGIRRALAGANRIFEILDAPVAIKEREGASEVKETAGRVSFQNVTFQYANHPTLVDVSFEVRPGERIAVVGKTGSGKTTILNLIPRFYDVNSGKITIDGIDVRDIKIDSLRRIVGVVPQEAFIFPTSIRDNITLGDKSFTQDQVETAAKAAQIHDFIISLPEGYDTLVGERGVTLSGGQRQRLSTARAILRSPSIVLLDDSTSQVDVATEKQIDRALESLLKDRTSFIITNRISTAAKSDRVILLDTGRVIATDTHENLLKKNELYEEIFRSQIVEGMGRAE